LYSENWICSDFEHLSQNGTKYQKGTSRPGRDEAGEKPGTGRGYKFHIHFGGINFISILRKIVMQNKLISPKNQKQNENVQLLLWEATNP